MSIFRGPKNYIPAPQLLFMQPGISSTDGTIILGPGVGNTGAIVEGIKSYADWNMEFDSINPPTLQLLKNSGNSYIGNPDAANSKYYSASVWVKIIDFPNKFETKPGWSTNEVNIRKKKTKIVRLVYKPNYNVWIEKSGCIDFGAMGPYYWYDGDTPYRGSFSPISLGVAMKFPYSNGKNSMNFSLYSDYIYSLNTWYLITVLFESNGNQLLNSLDNNISLYINSTNIKSALFYGDIYNNRAGRFYNQIAGAPDFMNKTLGMIPNHFTHNLISEGIINFNQLREVLYSPINISGTGKQRLCELSTKNDVGNLEIRSNLDSTQYLQGNGIYY